MLKRIITGTGIFAVLIGMFASRIFWTTEITTLEGGDLTAGVVLFDAVLALMAIVGTFEVVRAMDVKMLFIEKIIALIFPIIVFPIATFCGATYAFIVIAIYDMLTVALSVFAFKNATLESVGLTMLSVFYPTGLILPLVAVNLMSFEASLLVFAVSPLCDTMAYFVGSALRGKKLCPEISPNKTISGAIGGIAGGAIGGVAVYFFSNWLYSAGVLAGTAFTVGALWADVIIFIVAGALFAALTELGDLAESVIKRKLGIKDMGKLFPGHGGMMDRIDGLSFVSPVAALIFCVIIPAIV
ncbi:phosphatidate cytidylyltransferase [Acidiphilium sp. CAG:727]|nr:phosphatidate cytidylyltransferase [Acidiphilium sp. CAG:727]